MIKKTPTTKRAHRTGAKPPALTWTAEIAHARHRWWWYVVVSWIGWTLSLVVVSLGNWSAALVTAAAAIGLIVINIGAPRAWKVTIEEKTVKIERPGKERFRYELPIERYRGFTVVQMPAGKRDDPQKAIALLPRARVRPSQLLVLPHDAHEADMLIQQFTDVLPYEEASAYRAADRLLERAARLLGLN